MSYIFDKSILILSMLGIVVGLLTGIFDSLFQFIGLDGYRFFSVIVFIIFFLGIYISTFFYRNKVLDGFMDFKCAFKNSFYIGVIASLTLAIMRFIYLKFIANVDLDSILSNTKQSMIDHSSLYTDELINNRLSFIEFSYDPFISSSFSFLYYIIIALGFAFFASIILRKIDRDISL